MRKSFHFETVDQGQMESQIVLEVIQQRDSSVLGDVELGPFLEVTKRKISKGMEAEFQIKGIGVEV